MQIVETVPVVPESLSHVEHGRRHSVFLRIRTEEGYLLFTSYKNIDFPKLDFCELQCTPKSVEGAVPLQC